MTSEIERKLPPINPNSEAWLKLESHLKKRLEFLRDDLERDGVDPQHTRGRIAEIRDLFREMRPEAPIEGTASVY